MPEDCRGIGCCRPSVAGRRLQAIAEREIAVLARFKRSVQSKEVNWLPWSVFIISGRPKLVNGLVQGRAAEVRLQRVQDAPGQHLAVEPVHALRRLKAIAYRSKDGHQIKEALSHRQVGDVAAPDLIWPVDPQPAQQIAAALVPLGGPAGVGFLVPFRDIAMQCPAGQRIGINRIRRRMRFSFTAWPAFCR